MGFPYKALISHKTKSTVSFLPFYHYQGEGSMWDRGPDPSPSYLEWPDTWWLLPEELAVVQIPPDCLLQWQGRVLSLLSTIQQEREFVSMNTLPWDFQHDHHNASTHNPLFLCILFPLIHDPILSYLCFGSLVDLYKFLRPSENVTVWKYRFS